VPLSKEVAAIAKGAADKTKAGDPRAERTIIGSGVVAHPVGQDPEVHRKGIEEGATLVAGGPGLFSDDTSTSCDTAFAKICARVLSTALAENLI
jgi:hypothetical protein